MSTIYLHMGSQKAGSTTLQASFFAGRQALFERGIHYIGRDNYYEGLYPAFQERPETYSGYVKRNLSLEEIRKENQYTKMVLTKSLKAAVSQGAESIILSTENLNKMQPTEMERLRAYLNQFGDVKAVYIYRNLTSWWASFSGHGARVGRHGPISYREALGTVYDSPQNIIDVFGRENTIFLKFENAVKEGICNAFLKSIGAPSADDIGIDEIYANEGLTETAVEAMFLYNSFNPVGSGTRTSHAIKTLTSLPGPKYRLPGMTPTELEDYRERFKEIEGTIGLKVESPDEVPTYETPPPRSVRLDALSALVEDYGETSFALTKAKKQRLELKEEIETQASEIAELRSRSKALEAQMKKIQLNNSKLETALSAAASKAEMLSVSLKDAKAKASAISRAKLASEKKLRDAIEARKKFKAMSVALSKAKESSEVELSRAVKNSFETKEQIDNAVSNLEFLIDQSRSLSEAALSFSDQLSQAETLNTAGVASGEQCTQILSEANEKSSDLYKSACTLERQLLVLRDTLSGGHITISQMREQLEALKVSNEELSMERLETEAKRKAERHIQKIAMRKKESAADTEVDETSSPPEDEDK
ncbi:hypothetical protein [uncultured Roseovarius sp.]|uniref:hypothetical protein n=1 Tax=uncultured Roseovarius sp. TaxID=293344 RepID=UPI002638BC5E|nr:hypothetical protein [uncultured Roseovarius sp.]